MPKTLTRTSDSTAKREQLKRLAKQHRTGLYEMLKIVHELLSDHEYVDEFGGEDKLLDSLEATEFAHFGGQPKLSAMLRAWRHNPKRAVWEEHDFNIRVLIDLATPAREREETTRVNWKALAKELQSKLERAEAALDEHQRSQAEMRTKMDSLLAENGELKGQIKQLERMVGTRT